MSHGNARTTVHGRKLIVARHRAGWRQAHIAAAMGMRSSQWIGDGGRPVALKRQVAGARGVSLHKARGPAIEDRFFLGN